jgi:hypothetical protein
MTDEKKYFVKKTQKNKVYGFSFNENLVHRLKFVRDHAKKKDCIDINKTLEQEVLNLVMRLEKKYQLNPNSWKNQNRCPKCSSLLLERKGVNGMFMGCSNFPNCKFTN